MKLSLLGLLAILAVGEAAKQRRGARGGGGLYEWLAQPKGLQSVKQLIEHMIAQKQSDLHDSIGRKQFCDGETAKTKNELKAISLKLEKQNADKDKMEAELAELKDSIADLTADVAELHKTMAKEAEARSKDHDAYQEERQRFEQRATLRGSDDERAAAQQGRVAAETEEARRDLEFRRHQQQMEVSIASKTQEVKHKQSTVLKQRSSLADATRDLETLQERQGDVKEYSSELDRQCIVRAEPAKERAARRNEEIASLKDAYEVLSTDSS